MKFAWSRGEKWTQWLSAEEWAEKYPNFNPNYRTVNSEEIIIDLDALTLTENELAAKKISTTLKEKKLSFKYYFTGSRGFHFHLLFTRALNAGEKKAWIQENLKEFSTIIDFTKCAENNLILIEGAPNRKTWQKKELVESFGDWKNVFPEKIVEEKKPAVFETISQILDKPHPTEQERVSAVMKVLEKNKWDDYNKQFTEKKVKGVIKAYGEKENPFREKKDVLPADDKKLTPKKYTYFEKLKKDKRFIIEDLFYPRTLNAVWSPPGSFKSMLQAAAAILVANGKTFLNKKTKKVAVLILDNENPEQEIKRRLMALRRGHNIRRKNFALWYITDGGALFDSEDKTEELFKFIQDNKIKLVIVDTLHRFSDYEENSADAINRLYRNILRPMAELDCCVIYLHHTGKNNDYRGSVDLLGCVDSAYKIQKKGEDKFEIIPEKNRFGMGEHLYGFIDFGENAIKIIPIASDDAEAVDKTKFMDVVKKIGELFSIKGDSWKTCDIHSEFELMKNKGLIDVCETTVKKAISWMKKKGKIKQLQKGEYARCWEGEFSL